MIALVAALYAQTAQAEPFRYSVGSAVAVGVGADAQSVAIGDVTGDGLADVVMTSTNTTTVNNVFVFPQRATGGLAGGQPFAYSDDFSSWVSALQLADLDEDGIVDAIVGWADGVSVLLSNGDGTLAPRVLHNDGADFDDGHTSFNAISVVDINGDDHLDVIATGSPLGIGVFYGDGTGDLDFQRWIGDIPLVDSEYGDLDGDGKIDVVGAFGADPGSVDVFTNDKNTIFSTTYRVYAYSSTVRPDGVGVGDVNGDGRDDVVVSADSLYQHLQQKNGDLGDAAAIPSLSNPSSVLVADFDVDGDDDVAVTHNGQGKLGIYLQDEGKLEAEDTYTVPLNNNYGAQAVAAGDFSDDGCPDIALANGANGLVTVIGNCFPDTDGDGVLDTDDKCPFDVDDGTDGDDDGIPDACDVCVDVFDPDQPDADDNGIGDACDFCDVDDEDDDGRGDACDNCVTVPNPDQFDGDLDTIGHDCDNCADLPNTDQADDDDDDVGDLCDNCLSAANTDQSDVDDDGLGDVCDICPDRYDPEQSDGDGDGLGDHCDLCPGVSDEGDDGDGDGIGDGCDCAPADATRPTATGACEVAPEPFTLTNCTCASGAEPGGLIALLVAVGLAARRRR